MLKSWYYKNKITVINKLSRDDNIKLSFKLARPEDKRIL